MKKSNIGLLLILIIISISTGFSVEVSTTSNTEPEQKDSIVATLMGSFTFALVIGVGAFLILFGLIAWMVFLVYQRFADKFYEELRKAENLEFACYYVNAKQCIRSARKDMRNPLWWSFSLIIKRSNVFIETETGRQLAGKYDGHTFKKEGFFVLSLYNRFNFREKKRELVVMPIEVSSKIVYFDSVTKKGRTDMIIRCEGIDETLSTEFFSIPLIKDDTGKFINFSNMIWEQFLKEYNLHKVITELNDDFKRAVRDATEINPNLQYRRKSGGNL